MRLWVCCDQCWNRKNNQNILKNDPGLGNKPYFTIRANYWSDYDNVTINVTDRGLEFCNTELLNASTESLVRELERRGIHVSIAS